MRSKFVHQKLCGITPLQHKCKNNDRHSQLTGNDLQAPHSKRQKEQLLFQLLERKWRGPGLSALQQLCRLVYTPQRLLLNQPLEIQTMRLKILLSWTELIERHSSASKIQYKLINQSATLQSQTSQSQLHECYVSVLLDQEQCMTNREPPNKVSMH